MNDANNRLAEVASVFLKLGFIAFGGPAAHVALMEEEIVRKRRWMDHQQFLDLMGATNLIPGPNSTEMTMHCGWHRAGIMGLFVAGLCFVLPATLITLALAWFYTRYGQLPEVQPFISGIQVAVLIIIAKAVFKLGKKALKGWELWLLGGLVVAATLLGVNPIIALLSAGILGVVYFSITTNRNHQQKLNTFPLLLLPFSAITGGQLAGLSLFWVFLKVGAVLYGSGYVLFAYLQAELVVPGWLTDSQLLDAIAVGQFTPGPVLSTATFIGYQMQGFQGALLATVGIFLPSFIFVLMLNPLIKRMRQSTLLGYFLDAVNVAAVAVMLAVLIQLAETQLVHWKPWLIAALSALYVFGYSKSSTLQLIIGSAIVGYLLSLI